MAEWPLQLVLLGGRWWLLIEHDAIGQRAPLLEALPIEELHGFPLGARAGCSLAVHRDALAGWASAVARVNTSTRVESLLLGSPMALAEPDGKGLLP